MLSNCHHATSSCHQQQQHCQLGSPVGVVNVMMFMNKLTTTVLVKLLTCMTVRAMHWLAAATSVHVITSMVVPVFTRGTLILSRIVFVSKWEVIHHILSLRRFKNSNSEIHELACCSSGSPRNDKWCSAFTRSTIYLFCLIKRDLLLWK
mgnify:CR=1 FL=1